MKKALLIFSGHNQRAVLALCRFLSEKNVDFYLVGSTNEDDIFKTKWAKYVIYTRKDRDINFELFKNIQCSVDKNTELIYTPTTEYINNFVLENRKLLAKLKINFPLVDSDVYDAVTSKEQSIEIIERTLEIKAPKKMEWNFAKVPCVFKPKKNIEDRDVLYPILCFNKEDLVKLQYKLSSKNWFIQEYIYGQSLYLCGYLAKDERYKFYWQANLIQQPNGKSIVLAKTIFAPNINEGLIFQALSNLGYFGPVMLEVIQQEDGLLNYIEINPRFWGPLQLGVDACPEMFDLYLEDIDIYDFRKTSLLKKRDIEHWYAWSEGYKPDDCKTYPLAESLSLSDIRLKLIENDVMNRE